MISNGWALVLYSEEWNEKGESEKGKDEWIHVGNEESSMYFDYDFVNKKQFPFEGNHFFSLWAGMQPTSG
jgi:alpha,alpha-trehalase